LERFGDRQGKVLLPVFSVLSRKGIGQFFPTSFIPAIIIKGTFGTGIRDRQKFVFFIVAFGTFVRDRQKFVIYDGK
jgi:hypothetical protein